MKPFMPHQQKAFEYASGLARIALFMEMRLGKTRVAIRWAEHERLDRILTLTPLAPLDGWKRELSDEEVAEEDVVECLGSNRIDLAKGPGKWFLSTYESTLYKPEILDLPWDGIILDESTKIRVQNTDTTKLLQKKADNFGHRAILSGLPAPESELDYFEQMRFVWGSFMRQHTWWNFRQKYFWQSGFEWEARPFVRKLIREEVGKRAFVMTRKEAGIGSKKIREIRKVKLNDRQKALYKQIKSGFEWSDDGLEQETKWVPVKYVWFGMVAGGFTPVGEVVSEAKLEEIRYLLKNDLKGEKLVIWFKHTWELNYVYKELNKDGYKMAAYYGEHRTGSEDFRSGKAQVICAQGKCARYGIDWSIASTAIYYSNWYDGELRAQSEDRIVHPMKQEPLLYIDLVTDGSIDEDVVEILNSKRSNSQGFMETLAKKWGQK